MHCLFDLHGAGKSQRRMEPAAVVPCLDVVCDSPPCISDGVEDAIRALGFQSSEKTFYHGVVVAAAGGAHAWLYATVSQQLLVTLVRVQAAAVTVMDKRTAPPRLACMRSGTIAHGRRALG